MTKCWSCGGDIAQSYPVEICRACHNAGGGVHARDLVRKLDGPRYTGMQKELIARLKEIILELEKEANA